MEIIHGIRNWKYEWKVCIVKVFLILSIAFIYKGMQQYIYRDTGYTPNEEVTATYHHYMVMGLNQQTTGSYSSDDAALIGQHPVKAERIEFQTELVKTRIKELGILGYLKFLLTKTVMTFNDGTFNWGREGGYSLNGYPVLSDSSYVASLRVYFGRITNIMKRLVHIVRQFGLQFYFRYRDCVCIGRNILA